MKTEYAVILKNAPSNPYVETTSFRMSPISLSGFIISSIQPLGWFGQEPEPNLALVRCILGKFLGVVCHCFPPVYQLFVKIVKQALFP
jgi:hypothetical protein